MELFESEKRMIEFLRRMGIHPIDIVSSLGPQCDCGRCPLKSTCSRIFGKQKKQCALILECWINEIPFNLPVSKTVDQQLKDAGFVKIKKERFYSFDEDGYSVFLTPNVKEWVLEISLSPDDRKPYAYERSFQELMGALWQKVEKQVEVTKEFVEDENKDVPYNTTIGLLDNARKLRKIFNVLEQKFKKVGLIK